jgi:hypothetical protein
MAEKPARTSRSIAYALGALALTALIALSFDRPGGPVGEARGIVESVAYVQSKVGLASQQASVRLDDGSLVQAIVVSPTPVRSGQAATMRIYRRVITGIKSYEIIGAT